MLIGNVIEVGGSSEREQSFAVAVVITYYAGPFNVANQSVPIRFSKTAVLYNNTDIATGDIAKISMKPSWSSGSTVGGNFPVDINIGVSPTNLPSLNNGLFTVVFLGEKLSLAPGSNGPMELVADSQLITLDDIPKGTSVKQSAIATVVHPLMSTNFMDRDKLNISAGASYLPISVHEGDSEKQVQVISSFIVAGRSAS